MRSIDEFIEGVANGLDPAAHAEFGELERITLRRQMEAVGMRVYPLVSGDPTGERCDGHMICDRCGQSYYDHPPDWRVIGYDDVPFLQVLCDGRRVKL